VENGPIRLIFGIHVPQGIFYKNLFAEFCYFVSNLSFREIFGIEKYLHFFCYFSFSEIMLFFINLYIKIFKKLHFYDKVGLQ